MFIHHVRHYKRPRHHLLIALSLGGNVHLNRYILLALYDVDKASLLDVISTQVEVEILLSGSSTRRRPRMNTHAAVTLKGMPA